MFEEVLPENGLEVIDAIGPVLEDFYLACGTGLALQLGHRKSEDLDFFSNKMFNPDALLASIPYDKKIFTELGTVHCQIKGIRVSLFYPKSRVITITG